MANFQAADRGPAKNQIIKPKTGRIITKSDQITFCPVVAPDPKIEIKAQISSAKMIIPPIPVSSNIDCSTFLRFARLSR